ncbi:hypothetical protein [Sorangium sp. So ce1097]|uniref:hypothetical protein n=1 Tax=Sorangium sp. So ce1097 TaxID=3133330 RepID=UPI003F644871
MVDVFEGGSRDGEGSELLTVLMVGGWTVSTKMPANRPLLTVLTVLTVGGGS